MLLPARKAAAIASLIIPILKELEKNNQQQFINSFRMILNVLLALIEKQELKFAAELYKKLDSVYVPEAFLSIILKKKFYYALLIYCKIGNDYEINNLLAVVKYLGLFHTLADFQDDFAKVKHLYKKS